MYTSYNNIGIDVGELGKKFQNMEELVQLPNYKNCVLLRKLYTYIDFTIIIENFNHILFLSINTIGTGT